MKFKLKRAELPVTMEDENGVESNYTLRELSGSQRDQFIDAMTKRMKFDSHGKASGMTSFSGVESDLIAMSLFNAEGQPVPAATVRTYPASVQKELFKEAQKLSGLDDKAEEIVKND